MPDVALDVESGQTEPAVSVDDAHLLARSGELCRGREARAGAQAAELSGVQPVSWAIDLQHTRGERHDIAAVSDNRCVVVQEVTHLFDQPHRVNRRLGAVEHLLVGGLERAVLGLDLFDPRLARRAVASRLHLVHDLAKNGLGVAHNAHVDVAILTDLRSVHHDLDELRVLREHVV